MRFKSIRLQGFKPFKDSGIRNIVVDFNEDVQIIIGSNGSGKSVFLDQLSPYPEVKTIFESNGFKSQTMEKDGHLYTLQSDYSKSSSPHLFLEGDADGENINIGRTTKTQEDLIKDKLEITPLLNDLIMNRYRFPKWTPENRKKFLMQVNPDQIGFVLVLAKQTSSKIKACKANLARLQSRRILLEADILTIEDATALENERASINKALGDFQSYLMTLEVGLRSVGNIRLLGDEWLQESLPLIRKYQSQLSRLSHIDRRDSYRELDREVTVGRLAVVESQLIQFEDDQIKQADILLELETRYRELDLGGDLQELDASISRLESEKDKLQILRPDFDLSPEDLQKKYKELDHLTNQLQLFNTLDRRLLSQRRRQHRERMYYRGQDKRTRYQMRITELEDHARHLDKQHTIKPRDIPEKPCAKELCPLYVQFFEQWELAEQKRERVQQSIEKGYRKLDRLNLYMEALGEYLETSQPFHDRIAWLINHAGTNPILYNVLSRIDILSTLSTGANRIINLTEAAYDHIGQWHKLQYIQDDLDTAHALKQRQLSQASGSTVQLVRDIEATKLTLQNNRDTLTNLASEKITLTRQLDDINLFNTIKQRVLAMRESHIGYAKAIGAYGEREALLFLKSRIEQARQQYFLDLGSIETKLRAQETLRERLQEEVVSQISLIEEEMEELQEIEKALLEIPRENMARFINKVFDQANRLIDAVWSIPLKIELISDKNDLTYEFMVTGDNQSERELSKCSLGQTDILSFSINLALRIVLGHLNYPLCLDEADAAMDDKHRRNFVVLLKRLVDEGIVSQLFLVSHQAIVHSSFANAETLVIRQDNILLPPRFNTHAVIQ